jgi:4-hydroxybenzoate polyprenyltransferase
MSKSDKLKEEIGWLKVVFGILVATDISLVAWLAQNYSRSPSFLLAIGVLGVLAVTAGIVRVNKTAYRKIDELEEL